VGERHDRGHVPYGPHVLGRPAAAVDVDTAALACLMPTDSSPIPSTRGRRPTAGTSRSGSNCDSCSSALAPSLPPPPHPALKSASTTHPASTLSRRSDTLHCIHTRGSEGPEDRD
jgi:hypothetical protein